MNKAVGKDMWLRYILVSLVTYAVFVQVGRAAKPKPSSFVPSLWRPPTGTADEFRQHHGMDRATAVKQKAKVREYKTLVAQKYGRQVNAEDLDEFIGDTLPTLEQIEDMVEKLKHGQNPRFKRAIRVGSSWSMPILYRLDGTQTPTDAASIRRAISIWETETCILFQEIDDVTGVGHYILFTTETTGCWSYVGNVGSVLSPQAINLQPGGCTSLIGTILHEIGHALGMYHEHTRFDRDFFVDVTLENVKSAAVGNFEIVPTSDTSGIPYDYNSVMHYSQRAFSIDPASLDTIVPKDSSKSNIIGQRAQLSFRDVKLANIDNDCISKNLIMCGMGSDPCPGEFYMGKDCQCKCPDGIGGALCDGVDGSDPECNLADIPLIASDTVECIESPNYASRELQAGTKCNWDIQAPSGSTVTMWFTDISLPCWVQGDHQDCAKWVDIRDIDFYESTRRFCCHTAPADPVVTFTNRAIVTLRTEYTPSNSAAFRLCYQLTDPQGAATTTTGMEPTTQQPTSPSSMDPTTAATTEPTTQQPTSPTSVDPTTAATTEPATTARTRRPRRTRPTRRPRTRPSQAPAPPTRPSQAPAPPTRPSQAPAPPV